MSLTTIIQIIVSIFVIGLILVQERSSEISGLLGGGEGGFYRTRRGMERVAFGATLGLVALFAVLSLLTLSK